MSNPITPQQLRRLQTVYSQLAARSLELDSTRECRLRWASRTAGVTVTSFSRISQAAAKQLIDAAQAELGIAQTTPPLRRRNSKRDNQKLGTEGRKDQIHADSTMLQGNEDVLSQIFSYMAELGMDNARLKAFLRSSSGPNKGRDTMYTLGDANRVMWALKPIVDRQRKRNSSRAAKHTPTAEAAA